MTPNAYDALTPAGRKRFDALREKYRPRTRLELAREARTTTAVRHWHRRLSRRVKRELGMVLRGAPVSKLSRDAFRILAGIDKATPAKVREAIEQAARRWGVIR